MSDIARLQKQFNLTEQEAIQLFREGELTRLISKVEGNTVKCTMSRIFRTSAVECAMGVDAKAGRVSRIRR